MKKTAFLLTILTFLSASLFAEISLLSPVEGIWANKQMLVIENDFDGDFYYSIDGSDPETFGFAYDGPVLIDVSGEVKLRISHIKQDFSRESAAVDYTVVPEEALLSPYADFISTFYDSGLVNYSAGSDLIIPGQLYCAVGNSSDAYFPGTTLSLSPYCILNRYIPFVILDPALNKKWRFVVHTFPQSAGIFSRRDVPFEITDWDTITFTDENFIYKIDSDYWELPKESKNIDRSVSHMISWQDLNYEPGNVIEFFILPPRPEIKNRKEADGSVVYYIDGDDSYTISVFDEANKEYQELFTEIGADIFYGDKLNGTLTLGIFSSSVYQGKIEAEYSLNKRPPEMPAISSSAAGFYSRQPVHINVSGNSGDDCALYVSVSEPLILNDVSKVLDPSNPVFNSVVEGSFVLAENNSFEINLESLGEGASYYKISAYSANNDKMSFIADYSVIVDQYNYYYDDSVDPSIGDGTAIYPYASFTQCLQALNESRNACLNVKGKLVIPSGINDLLANTEIKTEADGEIFFEAGSTLVVKNSTLSLKNCKISNESSSRYQNTIPLFKLENSVLTLQNCVVSTNFIKNANIFETYNSVLNVTDSLITAIGKSYASCISSVNSKLNIKNTTLTAAADTCVVASVHEGFVDFKENIFKISGKNGRIAELFAVQAGISDCNYKAEFQKNAVSINPIYKNSATELKEVNNVSTGF